MVRIERADGWPAGLEVVEGGMSGVSNIPPFATGLDKAQLLYERADTLPQPADKQNRKHILHSALADLLNSHSLLREGVSGGSDEFIAGIDLLIRARYREICRELYGPDDEAWPTVEHNFLTSPPLEIRRQAEEVRSRKPLLGRLVLRLSHRA